MAKFWKRYGDWAIGLRSNLFAWARIKLTALYLLIVAVILAAFSLALYQNFSQRLRRDFERGTLTQRRAEQETFAEDAIERAQDSILTVDVFIFVAAAGLSYFLAGFTLKPIRKAMDDQRQFSADASHELRTPLAVMRSETEVLLRGNKVLAAEAKIVLQSNLEEIQTMSQMVEDLLQLSRGQEAHREEFRRLDLGEVVQAVGDKFSKMADIKGLRLSWKKPAQPLWVFGDQNKLRRMLSNVLANALAFTPPGGRVSLALSDADGEIAILVSDTGVGIPQKDLPRVFERFYKVQRAGVSAESGAGLGLAIVKQIVQQHHGNVDIQSGIGQGATVKIQIPKSA